MNKVKGGFVFPIDGSIEDDYGMTLRDYAALKAMQALISNDVSITDCIGYSFKYADEFIKQRNKNDQ